MVAPPGGGGDGYPAMTSTAVPSRSTSTSVHDLPAVRETVDALGV
jgi:hypothetical protein